LLGAVSGVPSPGRATDNSGLEVVELTLVKVGNRLERLLGEINVLGLQIAAARAQVNKAAGDGLAAVSRLDLDVLTAFEASSTPLFDGHGASQRVVGRVPPGVSDTGRAEEIMAAVPSDGSKESPLRKLGHALPLDVAQTPLGHLLAFIPVPGELEAAQAVPLEQQLLALGSRDGPLLNSGGEGGSGNGGTLEQDTKGVQVHPLLVGVIALLVDDATSDHLLHTEVLVKGGGRHGNGGEASENSENGRTHFFERFFFSGSVLFCLAVL